MDTKRLVLSLVVSLLVLAATANADNVPYPIRQGAQWMLSREGAEQSTLVESLSDIQTPAGVLHTALIRRSDGTDRIVFRHAQEWTECEPQTVHGKNSCQRPFTYLSWPLEVGKKWSSGGFDFMVVSKEPVATPFKNFPDCFKIFYTTTGSSDPLGELWFAEGIGRIRIREGQLDFLLTAYEAGAGEPLKESTQEAIDAFLNPDGSVSFSLPPRAKIKNLLPALAHLKLLPLYLFQIVITILVLVFGIGIWRSLRAQNSVHPKDEAKILSLLGKDGSLKDAEERLSEMVRQFPLYPDLRHHLALAQKGMGRLDEARKNWEEAIRLNPTYIDARLGLANLLLAQKLFQDSALHFEAVVKVKPTFADAQLGLGIAFLEMRDFRRATEALARSLELNPRLEEARRLLIECRNLSQP